MAYTKPEEIHCILSELFSSPLIHKHSYVINCDVDVVSDVTARLSPPIGDLKLVYFEDANLPKVKKDVRPKIIILVGMTCMSHFVKWQLMNSRCEQTVLVFINPGIELLKRPSFVYNIDHIITVSQ